MATAGVLGGLAAWMLSASTLAYPHYLGYFSPFAGPQSQHRELLGDSNIDWGHDLPTLAAFLHRVDDPPVLLAYVGTDHPGFYGIRFVRLPYGWSHSSNVKDALPRLLVVSVNLWSGLFAPNDDYAWLREFEPDHLVGTSLLLYDIEAQPQLAIRLAGMCEMVGDHRLAPALRSRAEQSLEAHP